MSMPNFPTISPEMTRENALNMILASIAMEELGLSHIINAEGEKIQCVIKQISEHTNDKQCIEDILEVNRSVESLMNVVMQNQRFLKNKMESVLEAISSDLGPTGPAGPTGCMGPPGPTGPPGCVSKCIASFHEPCEEFLWKEKNFYPWKCSLIIGDAIHIDSCKCSKIMIEANKYYSISFNMNITAVPNNLKKGLMINLVTSSTIELKKWFTYCFLPPYLQQVFTISSGNIKIHTIGCNEGAVLALYLVCPAAIRCGQCNLSIVEL